MKATVKASPDIAFIKYWGKKNEFLRLPENGSVSMILDGLFTTTMVEFIQGLDKDYISIDGETEGKAVERVVEHLDRIRKIEGVEYKAKVISENNFPKSTGLSSSGSGFAALTRAAALALELDLSEKELSILARQGSGSACRCVCGGFVEWLDGDTSETSYSQTIFPKEHWDLRDIIVILNENEKRIPSTEGHKLARSSPFFKVRQNHIRDRILEIKEHIKNKDFEKLGRLIEKDCLEFHGILLTSNPPLIMWRPGTIEVMLEAQRMRRDGVQAYFTINTGHNAHVITLPKYKDEVKNRLSRIDSVREILEAKAGDSPKVVR